jgi:hypothetical protein
MQDIAIDELVERVLIVWQHDADWRAIYTYLLWLSNQIQWGRAVVRDREATRAR